MKKFLTYLFTAVMLLAVIYASGEDENGKLVAKSTFPALAVAGLCAFGLNRLEKKKD